MSGYYELLTLFALLLTDMNGNRVRFKRIIREFVRNASYLTESGGNSVDQS